MAEQQKTFGELVGMDNLVPTARLPLDLIECSDGVLVCDDDVHYDCRDQPHSNESDRLEADVAIVTEILDGVGKFSEQYHTENEDYPNGFPLGETSHEWRNCIEDWLEDAYPGRFGDNIIKAIYEEMDESDAEPEYNSNDWDAYSGDGCCLYSFEIGEIEEQIDVASIDELHELHIRGDLDTILDNVNCDVYVMRHQRRVKNETTGHYENVGRKTYNQYDRQHPTFEVYTNPGGQWQFVVSAERMKELLVEAILHCARKLDTTTAWNVYTGCKYLNTVYYTDDCDSDYVRTSLIDNDGYDVSIRVVQQ